MFSIQAFSQTKELSPSQKINPQAQISFGWFCQCQEVFPRYKERKQIIPWTKAFSETESYVDILPCYIARLSLNKMSTVIG